MWKGIKGDKFDKISLCAFDSPNIDVYPHEVQLVQFHNHAEIKQATHAKLLSCEKGLIWWKLWIEYWSCRNISYFYFLPA